jgi:cytochrome c oxidase cbb3-type subunit III
MIDRKSGVPTLHRQPTRKRTRRRLAPFFALALLAGIAGCGRPDPANRPVRPDRILDFSQLYATNCAGCHGAEGRLGAAPPLADPLFLSIVPNEALHDVISNGRDGTLMPTFAIDQGGSLTAEQVKILVEGLKKEWGSQLDEMHSADLPSYATSAGDETRGQQVFDRACATCHGEAGRGGPNAGDIHASAFLALTSEQFLRRIAITGRPDLGMPDFRRLEGPPNTALTPQDIDDVVALLRAWRTQALSLAAHEREVPLENSLSDTPPLEVKGSRHARID